MATAERSTTLPDLAARIAASTAIDRSWLVEAGAGSGKTSIMAGRVAVLLSHGVEPKHVAAITFTEFAASELQIRVDRFVRELANGNVPGELGYAFSGGVSPKERENLTRALNTLDQLTCSTIHGFAQALIKPYPVEASIDPGADIIDPAEADLAFAERLDAWLKKELSGEGQDGIVAQLILGNEADGLKLVREVAAFRRANRDACPADNRWDVALVATFTRAVEAFRQQLTRIRFRETTTDGCLEAFASLDATIAALSLAVDSASPAALLGVLQLARPAACFTQNGSRKLQAKGSWGGAARAAGASKSDGEQAFDVAARCYEDCHRAFNALVAAAAGEVLACLSSSMDELMAQWRNYKRAAALLDFDDLLYTARDLLAQHEPVRQALAKRYRHVLVDEFQDTDPLQTEILWRLCGEAPADGVAAPLARPLRPGALFLVGDPKQAIYRFRGADVNAYVAAREAVGAEALLEITANFRSVKPILDFVNARFAQPLSPAQGQPGFTALAATRVDTKKYGRGRRTRRSDGCREAVRRYAARRRSDARRLALPSTDRRAPPCRDPETQRLRSCEAGDIALLAPVGTDLWRFEEALEAQGIAVSTQAGKGFFWRQEIQDLIALTRSLADARDTLALGALLRGPLIGLSETELLDIADALPADPARPDRLPQLKLWSDVQQHPPPTRPWRTASRYRNSVDALVRRRLSSCSPTRSRHSMCAPSFGNASGLAQSASLANVDLFLEMARAYDVRGLRAFARDMRAQLGGSGTSSRRTA